MEAFGRELVVILALLVDDRRHDRSRTWCVVVYTTADLGVDWVDGASFDPRDPVSNEVQERDCDDLLDKNVTTGWAFGSGNVAGFEIVDRAVVRHTNCFHGSHAC